MGIPRLTSFVDNTFTGWQRKEISGNLIIDGFSMAYNLYSFDWSHGGQFPEYHSKIAHFFISLHQSGIVPIVVFDGIDYREEKMSTIISRRNNVIKTIHKHTASEQKRNIEAVVDNVLPPLAVTVFFMVMAELQVKFIVADGEGDICIYQLANAHSCPVLSSDSDFLMFKLRAGYIPFNRFHWEASPVNAEVFYYQAFCEQFHFRDESLRLLIPAINGNDFLTGVDSPRFLAHIAKIIAMETKGLNRLIQVVKYIQLYKSMMNFVDEIESISCLEYDEKARLRSNCHEAWKMYDNEDVISLDKMMAETELLAFNSEALPEWVLKQFREGNFSPSIMEALVVGKSTLAIFIDSTTWSSCVHASLSIRQHIYGLTRSSLVTEYYREGLELSGKGVHSSESINGRPLPSFDRIPLLSVVNREHLLYSILGCDQQPLQRLGTSWKLVMAATMFWATHAQPPPHLIKALILSFLVCSTCPYELPKMRAEFFIPITFRRSPKWMPPLHAFAQWQATYLSALALNQLLMLPLEAASPARLYDGKLAMFFALPDNGDHLAAMLPIDHQLYRELVGTLLPHQFSPSPPKPCPPSSYRTNQQPPRFQNAPRGHQTHPGGGQGRGQGSGNPSRGRGRGRAWSHASGDGVVQRREQVVDGRVQESSQMHPRNQSGAARGRRGKGIGVAAAKVVVSKPPKFTHENRYAALLGDDDDSGEDSD